MPLLPTTDGTAARAFFAKLDPEAAHLLQTAIQKAIATSSELSTEAAALGAMQAANLLDGVSDKQQPDIGKNAVKAVDENIAAIENTALDAAVAVFVANPMQIRKVEQSISGTAAAVAAGAAAAGGLTVGKARHDLYRAGSILGDAEAIASGKPEKIVRRVGQHIFWRAFGKVGRSIFRGLSGKR